MNRFTSCKSLLESDTETIRKKLSATHCFWEEKSTSNSDKTHVVKNAPTFAKKLTGELLKMAKGMSERLKTMDSVWMISDQNLIEISDEEPIQNLNVKTE